MGRLYMFLFAAEVILAIIALISCISAEEGELRALPRVVWIIIILLFPLVGAIVYLAAGRPDPARTRTQTWRPGSGFPDNTRPRTVAPDDDPEFLGRLASQSSRADEELMRRWEEDLKKREDDLRKKDKNPDEPSGSDS